MSQTAGVALRAQSIDKHFGELHVLKGVSLEVRAGEVAAIIGPSGSGKSTLLRCFNGLEDFQGGELDVADIRLTPDLQPRERTALLLRLRQNVGMVFQQFNLFPHLTVRGNVIEAPVHVLRQQRSAAVTAATQLLTRVGMDHKLDHTPEQLSGGQQQRVAIARALAMHPQLILFDEPTSALDPRMAAEVEGVMVDLAASGQTMIVVTHSLSLARRTAHTVHVLEEGQLIESGPARQVFESPRQEATRRLIEEARGH